MVQSQVNFLRSTIREVHKSLLRKETTVTKLCNNSLQIVEATKNLNPFITTCFEEAKSKSSLLDDGLESAHRSGSINPLYGIPIAIKDNFCTDQILTTCGSKMLHNFIPPYTATAVKRLIEANCLMIGKINLDEFAMGSSCTTSYYGPTANQLKSEIPNQETPNENNADTWYMAGGSSTGSAVAVGAGACFAALGTDTGGSTRQPASLTGTVGFKPTYGLISRFGLIPLVHCLDVVSILARNVDDVSLVFDVVVGQDSNDMTSVDHHKVLKKSTFKVPSDSSSEKQILRIGLPDKFITNGNISPEVSSQFDTILKNLQRMNSDKLKVELVKLELPHSSLATECYTIISSTEIASNMSCYDGVKYGYASKLDDTKEFNRDEFFKLNRDVAFGPEVKKRILLGNYFLLSGNREKYLVQAQKLRRLISDEFDRAFQENHLDVLLMPSTPTTSVTYTTWKAKQDGNKLFYEDYFLIPSNLANLPSISLPCGSSTEGLPIGLQLVARKFHDLDLLSVSRFFEKFTSNA